jgi:hypothetical protein
MAIDPNVFPSNILLGCNGASPDGSLNSLIINALGAPLRKLVNEGGADQVWFEPVSRHFFIAEGGCTSNCGPNKQGIEQLGIFDDLGKIPSDPSSAGGQDVFLGFQGSTTRRAHSVAAWSGTLGNLGDFTIAFVPVPAFGGTPLPFESPLCGPFLAQGCIGMLVVSPIPTGPEL